MAQDNRLDPKNVTVPAGFEVDLIYTVPRSEGSWVSLTTDPRGGFFACDQGGRGLFHIDVDAKGKATVKRVPINLSGAQGLVWAFDALWFHRNGGNLHRITDSDKDGELDKVEAMPSTRGGGEHGNHACVVTQDGKGLYLVSGNASPLAKVTRKRVQNWNEDFLNSRMWDARGRLAPGGWVTRFDPVTGPAPSFAATRSFLLVQEASSNSVVCQLVVSFSAIFHVLSVTTAAFFPSCNSTTSFSSCLLKIQPHLRWHMP